jgi:hypothetical protein
VARCGSEVAVVVIVQWLPTTVDPTPYINNGRFAAPSPPTSTIPPHNYHDLKMEILNDGLRIFYGVPHTVSSSGPQDRVQPGVPAPLGVRGPYPAVVLMLIKTRGSFPKRTRDQSEASSTGIRSLSQNVKAAFLRSWYDRPT